MKNKYTEPTLTVCTFLDSDVIRTSSEKDGYFDLDWAAIIEEDFEQ